MLTGTEGRGGIDLQAKLALRGVFLVIAPVNEEGADGKGLEVGVCLFQPVDVRCFLDRDVHGLDVYVYNVMRGGLKRQASGEVFYV